MKKLYSTFKLSLLVIWVLLLVACSFMDEQPSSDAQGEETSAGAAASTAAEPATTIQGEGEEQAKAAATEEAPAAPPEPVVEVIPSQKNQALEFEPIQAPVEPAESAPPTTENIPVSTGPNHFVITAAMKDKTHPNYGKGSKMGFLVNSVPGKEIVLERGQTYRFDVVTNPKHDVYISLKAIGWGSTPYSEGIEGMYTYKGTITIKPTDKTPDVLYYSCRNHPFMGGKIHVVDPGQTVKIAKTVAKAPAAAAAQVEQFTKADVQQKIMFADMLLKSKNSQTVLKSHISEAIALHKKAETELNNARQNLDAGKHNQAYTQADNAVALLKRSTSLVPNESALERMKERYSELQVSIKDFQASHKENYDRIAKKQGKDAAFDYDKKAVGELISSAETLAGQGDYLKANHNLEKAQRAITVAIHKMLNNQTIVYDLNFETAEEEYQYELRRFQGYDELVPIAVEQKKPAPGAQKLMESFVKKGQSLRDRAIKAAKGGDYPTAIAMLQDATKEVRRGLRMIGVMQ